jgi:acetyl-CoA C-acetyltransferase
MSHSWIIAGCRTPLGKFLGELSSTTAPQLAASVLRETIARSGLAPHELDEVILGQVIQAGVGQAPARQAALLAGVPASVPAWTVNKVCGSGLKAVMLADQAIRAGDAQAILAGGMENMSLTPHLLPNSRTGTKFGSMYLLDAMLHDGLTCASEKLTMGNIADDTAQRWNVSRTEQDAFAAQSQQRAAVAQQNGEFVEEIVPIEVAAGKQRKVIQADENIRPETTLESLQKLRPAFDPQGTVTAGNASQLSDGASAVLVVSEAWARNANTPWKIKVVATATTAREPRDLFLAPVDAIRQVLAKAQLSLDAIDLIELNEAFAVQCVACMRELQLPPEKVNVRGGAIALGHPIGASGARLLVTLIHTLVQRNLQRGIVSLCLGGGGAVALLVERSA